MLRDGDVDNADYIIWTEELGAHPGGGGGSSAASGGGGGDFSMDLTGDGQVDAADVAVFTKMPGFDPAAKDVDGDADFDADDLLAVPQQMNSSASREPTLAEQTINVLVFWFTELGGIGLP